MTICDDTQHHRRFIDEWLETMDCIKKRKLNKMISRFVVRCIRHPQYSVGIFLTSNHHMNTIYSKIILYIPENEIEQEYHDSDNQIRIKLKNGSLIDIFYGITYCCARRYSTVIYDKMLNMNYINTVIQCLYINDLYKIKLSNTL